MKKIIKSTNDNYTHLKFIFIMQEKKHEMKEHWSKEMDIKPMTKNGKF